MLPKIKRILYASDLGEGSRVVFRHALQEAIKHDAEIVFFHAVEPISDLTEDIIEDFLPEKLSRKHSKQIMESKRDKIEQRINDFIHDELGSEQLLNKPPVISITIEKPFKGILSTADKYDIDIIIMGDRESNAASRFFLGSTAQKVVHHSDIPVTIVPIKTTP